MVAKKHVCATPKKKQKRCAVFDDETLRVAVSYYLIDANAAEKKHGPISEWDVSRVTDMHSMFWEKLSFNGDLSKWDVSSVTNMSHMFFTAKTFNCDLSKWDVSSVTDMSDMFLNTEAFDGRLSTDHVEKMHAHGDQRTGRCLWKVARRLIKTRCIAYYWFELASRPDIHGKAPPGAIDAFCVEF